MPNVSTEAKAIFLDALDCQEADQRTSLLEQACGANAVLRVRVEKLLLAHRNAGAFLGGIDDVSDDTIAERPGTILGKYQLTEQIGEGGMGLVFIAEQLHPVRRQVAIKVIKPGMDTRAMIARFEAERQALALMDHPNIASVFDAGTTESGRPYYVMELVRGVSISQFCDENRLTTRDRLRLFISLCHGVQHAHQKGIIHRDLKSSNILITVHDGVPTVKVIDFGVAKAIGRQLADKTIYTRMSQLIGTPMYMSPEQADMSGVDIDTRSDIYSIGVVLYELLTGATPFDSERFKRVPFDEMRRIIRDEEPLLPSTRFNTLTDAVATESAANRRTEPRRLGQLFRGELDWIVMKALEKDRSRRYETASAFAADVQRYLQDEAVQACPPTLGYRLGKTIRRHRPALLAAGFVLLALVAGIIGTTWGLLRAIDAQANAVNEAQLKDTALVGKEAALSEAQDQLFLALVQQARAERASGRIGQRFEALKAIRKAARIRITPELRNEAVAALVLPDAELAREWERSTDDNFSAVFDGALERYVRMDNRGDLIVCRFGERREEVVTRLSSDGNVRYHGVILRSDAKFVACGYVSASNMDGGVRVWKVDGPAPVVILDEPQGMNGHAALGFQASGRHLAIGHPDKSVSIYDMTTGNRVQHLQCSAPPFHLAFHPRDNRLAVTCADVVQLFDMESGKELSTLRLPSPEFSLTYYLTWHPDGRRLAVGCNDRKIHLWDTQTVTEIMSPWTGHTSGGLVVAFNHGGDRLASVDWNGQTRIWNSTSGRCLLTMPGNFGLQFDPKDELVGAECSGNKFRQWRLAAGNELLVLRPRSAAGLDTITSPVVHVDGRTLAAATPDQLCFFDLVSGEQLASARLPIADAARPVYFEPPGIAPGGPDLTGGWMTGGQSGLYYWPVRQDSHGSEVMRIGPPDQISPNPGGGFSVGTTASADGRVVAIPQGHSTLLLHRGKPGKSIVLGPQSDVRFCDVSPDGRWVVTCSFGSDGQSKSLQIWDGDTGRKSFEWGLESYAFAKFSPDGNWLMTSDSSGPRLREVGTWKEARHFRRGRFAFSPDSRLLAINDELSVVRLLETTTGREVARLTGPAATWYWPACFTPDGTRLVATCSDETALYVWDLRLIRQELKELGLDWDFPEFGPADRVPASKAREIEIDLGGFGRP